MGTLAGIMGRFNDLPHDRAMELHSGKTIEALVKFMAMPGPNDGEELPFRRTDSKGVWGEPGFIAISGTMTWNNVVYKARIHNFVNRDNLLSGDFLLEPLEERSGEDDPSDERNMGKDLG